MAKSQAILNESKRLLIKVIPKVISDTADQMKKAQLLMVASSLAYTTIMSIVPLLAVSFAIFKAFGGMQRIFDIVEPLILSYLTEGTSEEVIKTLHGFIDNAHTTVVGIGGMVGLILTSMVMLSNAENAINLVWQAKVSRPLFQRIASYWLFITLGPLALSIAVGAATSSNLPLAHLLPSGTGLFLIAIAGFYCVYKFVPQTQVKWQIALLSAFVTASIWNLARYSYVLYTKHAVSYNNVYGSLGAIPILLLWIYILWVIVLGGAAFAAALQRRSLEKVRPIKS
jgi:membrane protein